MPFVDNVKKWQSHIDDQARALWHSRMMAYVTQHDVINQLKTMILHSRRRRATIQVLQVPKDCYMEDELIIELMIRRYIYSQLEDPDAEYFSVTVETEESSPVFPNQIDVCVSVTWPISSS